jgi:rhodanese-related sulfurtransferase
MLPRKQTPGLLLILLFITTLIAAGCASPATSAPTAVLPTAAPVVVQPTTAPQVAQDISAVLKTYITGLPANFDGVAPADAIAAMGKSPKPFILDVREPQELTDIGFIAGAVNIPLRQLLKNLDKLPADKGTPIITYCTIGHRGVMAAEILRLLGYTNVQSVFGGLNAWKAAKLPVATGASIVPVVGVMPQVDPQLLGTLDTFLSTLPDSFDGVTPAAVIQAMGKDPKPFILDVREPQELIDSGHIAGAVNIPLRSLLGNLDKLPADKNAPIITYCAIGHRGAMAMITLRLLGYTNVQSVFGGFSAWTDAKLPIAK